MFRVGIGYDAHRLESGYRLVLGGVEIPYHKGLKGHSDADVLVHAVCDAALGAAALGDIGEHFPDTDPKYRGISSLRLLEKVAQLLRLEGFTVVNVDTVVVAQAPKLKPYKRQMAENIARALGILPSQVSVKATTTEGMGFEGRGEGISAQAVVLIREVGGIERW
ncbi:2-C-methyl-D-erythritol 2,4-cyclodiphosphate synthase [Thermovibrio ammonificans]|jgi:2-C-methyl-D-erythritol 2,4-cyclodiphosphate synthase|uniref:2-C-methyl-D-erythritol 2,4-cyclodiphosphate synthase n=1 Tax=Thermovibrio ammonificans (strain DSM 15698 / JCM 12110 / HB-1) TaxID=648996 RepID=E8T604_THEA1|nr:2-C-methyl-D-erythritol 2,4-cyclodiphosphate synthase [Thermovibrio ammonificans]ADU96588.1 2C-methyl-D-erythritol 2,4-cyclodiphosphate synthase [Thermovibrio ammonificans HB-1]